MSEVREPLLRVDQVSRRFRDGDVQALEDVSVEAAAGEAVALTGPSGCGKSTLLSLIGLLDRPDRGRVSIGQQDLARVSSPHVFRARQLGFVFQHHHMVPTMTLAENVQAPMIALGLRKAERRERAAGLLHQVGLDARADFLPARVSGGERQRAAIARALANNPSVILADEPTGSLDSRLGRQMVDLLLDRARHHGALVIIATHNPEVASAMDRKWALRDGRLAPTAA